MSKLPEEVPVVMTGGKIWGEVTDGFTNSFSSNVGRGPYMWINWPCSDNSKRHLIMGGYANFLHPGVNPEKIQGIVLNPMQQSEMQRQPSRLGKIPLNMSITRHSSRPRLPMRSTSCPST